MCSGRILDLRLVKGDLRNLATVEEALAGCDAVIHLACISNDPSFELDPHLGKIDQLRLLSSAGAGTKRADVKRFIDASSSSVYGVKEGVEVTEDNSPLEPPTDYSKFKALCERILDLSASPASSH